MRLALRQFRRAPGFVAAAVLTLALGIGANATVFNWLNWLVRNPLPGVDTRDLYSVRWTTPGGQSTSTSWPTHLDIRERNATLAHFAVARMTAFSLGGGSVPERVFGMLVSSNYMDALGVRPMLGRTFRADEDRGPGAHAVALVSHGLWRGRLGGDPAIVGRTILLNTRAFTVVGVMPPGFQGGMVGLRHDIWVPATMRGEIMGGAEVLNERGNRWLEGYAKLKPGVTLAQAAQDLDRISANLARELQQTDRFSRLEAVPIWRNSAGRVLGPVLLAMAAVVAVVLLIACANVGNLLLARAASRRREMAVRLALGVGRGRLVRQLLVENGILSLAGGALALATVPVTGGLLSRFAPPVDMAISLEVPADWTVFAFTLGVSLLATLLVGLAPALRVSRPDVVSALKEETGFAAGRSRLRSALVVAQVALSLVLLVAAGLLLQSLRRAVAIDPGFDPSHVLVLGVDLLPNGYDAARGPLFLRQAVAGLAALPGVVSVSTVRRVPLGLGGTSSTSFSAEGYAPKRDEEMMSMVHYVGPDYFATMRTPILAGRDLHASDDAGRSPVVVVNQTLAARYYNGEAVGRKLRVGKTDLAIVGVAKDSKFQALDEPPTPSFYLPALQHNVSETNFLVRVYGDPSSAANAARREIHALDPQLPVHTMRPLGELIGASYVAQRMGGWMLGFFGALALALASVGLSGVLAFAVSTRSRELGIRVALGATRGGIVAMVVGEGMRLAGAGVLIGLALSWGATRFLQRLLLGVSPTDPATIAAVSGLLLAVAAAACLVPARRAALADPMRSIRAT
jgi:predicted permease